MEKYQKWENVLRWWYRTIRPRRWIHSLINSVVVINIPIILYQFIGFALEWEGFSEDKIRMWFMIAFGCLTFYALFCHVSILAGKQFIIDENNKLIEKFEATRRDILKEDPVKDRHPVNQQFRVGKLEFLERGIKWAKKTNEDIKNDKW